MLIPAYNAGQYLRSSVASIVGQSYRNLEIWVVDDGSTDGSFDTLANCDDSRVRILRQSNRGKPATLNALLDRINGDYYALQDADDISHPERIRRQVECLERNRELAGCFTGYDLIVGDRRIAPRFRGKSAEECGLDIENLVMPGHDPTAIYRVSMVQGLRYDPTLTQCEGHDYILRVGEVFSLCVLGECLYSYRIHLDSITRRDPAVRLDLVRGMLKRACERRGVDPAPILTLVPTPGSQLRPRDRDNNLATHFMESAIDLRQIGRTLEAVNAGLFCLRLNPLDPHYYKALLYALAPPSLTCWFRGQRFSRSGANRPPFQRLNEDVSNASSGMPSPGSHEPPE